MQLMTARQARNSFGELMNTMQREPVFITKNNKPVGAFVSIEDLKGTYIAEQFVNSNTEDSPTEKSNAEYDAYAKAKVLQSLQDFKENGSTGIPMEEVKKMVRNRLRK